MLKTIKALKKNLTGWKKNNEALNAVTAMSKAAIILASSVIFFMAIGYLIGIRLNNITLFSAIGVFIGLIIAWLLIIKQINKFLQ